VSKVRVIIAGMKYGYARTSTDDRTTALQLAALKRARCIHIYEDKGNTPSALPSRVASGRFDPVTR
jgi:DNA invertase Pin-like site-specific DNA recombinase